MLISNSKDYKGNNDENYQTSFYYFLNTDMDYFKVIRQLNIYAAIF